MAKNKRQAIHENLGKMLHEQEKMLNGPYRSSMGRNEEPGAEDPVAARDEVFAELDRLIAAGWGDVPRSKIEAVVAKLGYLPSKVPQGMVEPEPEQEKEPPPPPPPPPKPKQRPAKFSFSSHQQIEIDGVVKTLREWSLHTGLSENTITMRMWRNGWTAKQAIETPRRQINPMSRRAQQRARKELKELIEGVAA